MSKNITLISVAAIKERTGLHNNVDEKLVLPIIKIAQDMYIRQYVGSELFDRLIEGIDNNDLNAYENTLIDDYITDALCWFTMSELTPELLYQFYNKGVVKKTDQNTSQLSVEEIVNIENKHKRYAEHYAQCLVRFLQQNRNNYPEYLTMQLRIDSLRPRGIGFTTTIYLGDLEEEITNKQRLSDNPFYE